MRQYVATLALAGSAGGCSLIYNPDHIAAKFDADTITDVNPTLLHVDSLGPEQIYEGEGDGGSRPCLLAITGGQIQDAVVSIAPTTPNPAVMIVLGQQLVSPDHDWIGVEVTAKETDSLNEAAGDVALTVTVTQPGADPKSLPWTLKPLDRLTIAQFTAGAMDAGTLRPRYAKVDVAGDVKLTGTSRAIVVAMSSITFAGSITASASGMTPGPGGCAGGGIGSTGGCAGGGGGSSGGGGGGAGFSDVGANGGGTSVGIGGPATGDPQISSYAGHPIGTVTANTASGGGGGTLGVGGSGGGGGGGGTVELTAGGDLTVGAVTVDGAKGIDANGVTGSGGGGGGAGGVIVLRGHTITMNGALSSKGGGIGLGGTLGAPGGAGKAGRIRYDSATAPTLPTRNVEPHRGIAFVAAPTITTNPHVQLSLIGSPNDTYAIVIHDQANTQKVNTTGLALGADGSDTVTPTLTPGTNEICAVAGIGTYAEPEAKTCVHVVFLPGAP